jgi:choline dehydrogenase
MLSRNSTFAGDAWVEYWTDRTGPLTAGAIDGVAFPALPFIVNDSTAISDTAAAQLPGQYLTSVIDPTILAGYIQQHSLMTNALQDDTRAAYEIINANDGVLTVANMRPFSRGTLTLDSPYPFIPPVIDPRYGSNPIDTQVLQAAIEFNERLISTPSLSQLEPQIREPPADATDDEVVSYIHSRWQTEYHPAGTCPMMPLQYGGVVDPNLLVYGTSNLRVVDSSVFPLLPAAHLQAVVYGVAEKVSRSDLSSNVKG